MSLTWDVRSLHLHLKILLWCLAHKAADGGMRLHDLTKIHKVLHLNFILKWWIIKSDMHQPPKYLRFVSCRAFSTMDSSPAAGLHKCCFLDALYPQDRKTQHPSSVLHAHLYILIVVISHIPSVARRVWPWSYSRFLLQCGFFVRQTIWGSVCQSYQWKELWKYSTACSVFLFNISKTEYTAAYSVVLKQDKN